MREVVENAFGRRRSRTSEEENVGGKKDQGNGLEGAASQTCMYTNHAKQWDAVKNQGGDSLCSKVGRAVWGANPF